MPEPILPSDSTNIEKFLDQLKHKRHVERPEDSLFSESIPSEPIQESAADPAEVTCGTITGEMIEAAGRLSPFPPTNWEVTQAMVLDPQNKNSPAKIRAIGNAARISDTRELPRWAELKLVDLFGELAENRFCDRLTQERRAVKRLNRASEVALQDQLNFKREVLEECQTLYDEALAGIATAPFTFRDQPLKKAVENRASESIDALIRVPEPNNIIAASETVLATSSIPSQQRMGRARESRFPEKHKREFRDLLASGVELRALNTHPKNLDFGPWSVGYLNGDSADPEHRIKRRFLTAARKAAIAAGAPARANLVDWWISRLTRGEERPYIDGLIQLSAEYCEELESNALELRPLINGLNAAPGLRRDRYPCDHPVPYWLYAEPHRALPDPKEEFAYWDKRIWESFANSIEEVASWPRQGRRWVDKDGNVHVVANDEVRRRVADRVTRRTELLAAWTLGLTYDLAVLQANYIIDRGLRGEDAMRVFEQEAELLVEKVRAVWWTSSKRIGLSSKKLEKQGTDFTKPFREVSADLRELLFSALLVEDPPAPSASNLAVTHLQDHKPAVGHIATIKPNHEEGGEASSLEPSRSDESKTAAISDPKLRKMYESVTRYEMYKKQLRDIHVACKKYQTPDLLKKQFPDFEVWAVLDKDDVLDIVNRAFAPGRFAWALVKRQNGLGGKDDRTLKNYRRALKAAGIVL